MIISNIQHNVDGTIGYMSDFWTITAASEQAAYPASNLLTADLNQKWVSWGQRASQNWLEAKSDTRNTYRQIAMAGILGLNRTNPSHANAGTFSSNSYRIIVDSLYPIATRRRPEVTGVALTNLTGTAAMLNGPIDPPTLVPAGYTTTKMTASNPAANTVLVADFANHNATERPLYGNNHTIRVHYAHSADQTLFPTLEVKMRYNGLVTGSALTLQTTEQTSEGYILKYNFNPSTFAGLTGRVGIQVTGTSTGSSTPVPIGVEWIAELGWGTDNVSWDSSIDTRITSGIRYPNVIELPTKLSDVTETIEPYEITQDQEIYVYFEFSDWIEQNEFTTTPLGGFQNLAFYAGRLAITEGLSIGLKENGGYARRKDSDIATLRTYGGTLRGTRNALHWDEHDFNAKIQPQSVALGDLNNVFETAGMRNPLVIIPDENEPALAVYGILTRWEMPDASAWADNGAIEQYYDVSFSVIDAQARRTLRP